MRIAILGSTGQFGGDFNRFLNPHLECQLVPLSHDDVDVADAAAVSGALKDLKPDVVLNCAALVNADGCEDDPSEAVRINSIGALNVARACTEVDAVCVHISSDFVFDGRTNTPYLESDLPFPVNIYGVSKLAGEHMVQSASPRHLILRVASLFGVSKPRTKKHAGDFVDVMIAKSQAGEDLRVISDIYMSPTYTLDAVEKCLELVSVQAPFGVYHLTNAGHCSWYEFARTIFELLEWPVSVSAISQNEYKAKARRPPFSALATIKLTQAGLSPMRPWKDALRACLIKKGHLASSHAQATDMLER